ncbi:MAG: hypothetical protein HY606_00330 [Planctomycetes bacterium]|nr:hypothetical protein [Planctomycetota bacterium]
MSNLDEIRRLLKAILKRLEETEAILEDQEQRLADVEDAVDYDPDEEE